MREARNPLLEAAIDRDPSDENFQVYADWMQEHGNPRGELIALDLARKPPASIARDELDPKRFIHTWRAGFIDTIMFGGKPGQDVGDLAREASASFSLRFVRAIELWLPTYYLEQTPADLVFETIGARPTLRVLRIESDVATQTLSWTVGPDLAVLSRLYPDLVELWLHAGRYETTNIALPRLRRLTLRTTNATIANIRAVVDAAWPELEHLELWFGSSGYNSGTPVASVLDQLAVLLDKPFPKLRSLSLSNGEETNELIALVLASPLLPQLTALALTDSTLTDPGAQLLLAHRAKLAHLSAIDLDQNYLTKEMLAELQRVLPVGSTAQREPEINDGQPTYFANIGE